MSVSCSPNYQSGFLHYPLPPYCIYQTPWLSTHVCANCVCVLRAGVWSRCNSDGVEQWTQFSSHRVSQPHYTHPRSERWGFVYQTLHITSSLSCHLPTLLSPLIVSLSVSSVLSGPGLPSRQHHRLHGGQRAQGRAETVQTTRRATDLFQITGEIIILGQISVFITTTTS